MRGSLIAVRKRTMESAPTMPSESATLFPITAMTSVVTMVSITSETLKRALYTGRNAKSVGDVDDQPPSGWK